jgi:hypothetical protein
MLEPADSSLYEVTVILFHVSRCGPNIEYQKILSRNSVAKDEVWIGNWIYWTITLATTNKYKSLTELHTPKITVTTAHIKPSQSSLAVAW